jgi:hypothetical protein
MAKGEVEFEQWATAGNHTSEDHGFNRLDFREEIEMGLADNFRLSFYAPTWFIENSKAQNATKFDTAGVEAILLLSNPVTDAIGFGLYNEINVGPHELEFEQKLLFHKDIGPWTLAYNLIFETEVEGLFADNTTNQVTGTLGHSLGVSYSLSPAWRVGAEATLESEYANWNHYEHSTVYAGPTLGYQGEQIGKTSWTWWATLTPAFQLTDTPDEPDFQLRLIVGVIF